MSALDDLLAEKDAKIAGLETQVSVMKAALQDLYEDARRAFIRDAAMRIYIAGMTVPDKAPGVVTFQPKTCWLAAVELWAAKPEDC